MSSIASRKPGSLLIATLILCSVSRLSAFVSFRCIPRNQGHHRKQTTHPQQTLSSTVILKLRQQSAHEESDQIPSLKSPPIKYTNPSIIHALKNEVEDESNWRTVGTQHPQDETKKSSGQDCDWIEKRSLDYISSLVLRRSEARQAGNYEEADSIRTEINNYLPKAYQVAIKDISWRLGGGSQWRIANITQHDHENHSDEKSASSTEDEKTVLQLAHAALGMVAAASENNLIVDNDQLHTLIKRAEVRLTEHNDVLHELSGRKASDAAFWFALSGATSSIIFQHLTEIATYELDRFGRRSSCRPTDVFHIAERIAAAGIVSDSTRSLYQIAADCLEHKLQLSQSNSDSNNEDMTNAISALRKRESSLLDHSHSFGLHSTRPLLWIWRFSTRQRKQKAFLKEASKHWEKTFNSGNIKVARNKNAMSSVQGVDWSSMFADPDRPLVVDVGCGMGVSLLGLATLSARATVFDATRTDSDNVIDLVWSDCNFLGGDLSLLAVGYANGIAKRWGVSDKLKFCTVSAEAMMNEVKRSYPGEVKLVTINFPTPFRLIKNLEQTADTTNAGFVTNNGAIFGNDDNHKAKDIKGNTQLPTSSKSGFMVTDQLLRIVFDTLYEKNDATLATRGKLLLQSNCEDVAIEIRNIATKENIGFHVVPVPYPVLDLNGSKMMKRTEDWLSTMAKNNHTKVMRAEGEGWSAKSVIPSKGATETEVACTLNGTPIHRCLLEVR